MTSGQNVLWPSMRRPVGVKSILFWFRETKFVLPPSGHCRHASIRALELYLTCFIQHAGPTVAISQIQSDGPFLRNREAIAVTSLHTPFCMPGMTFVTAIFAVLRIPQRTLDIARHHNRKDRDGETCAGPKSACRKMESPPGRYHRIVGA
jgi:hypothetical protein